MVIYFSGTGNTKYCAQILAEQLSDELVDSAEYIREKKKGNFRSEKPWVFCAPIYVGYVPLVFEKFITSSDFKGNDDFYFVLTLGGNPDKGASIAANLLKKLCDNIGKNYMGTGHIQMKSNYVMLTDVKEEAMSKERISAAKEKVIGFADKIKQAKRISEGEKSSSRWRATIAFFYKLLIRDKKFFAEDSCIGCGLCEKICPLKNIKMVDNKPVWNGECTHCTACINRCPKKAIQYGKKTRERGRYYLKV